MKYRAWIAGRARRFALVVISMTALGSANVVASGNSGQEKLGYVHNVVATTLVPGTTYDNIVSVGCGWASGANFADGIDWTTALPAVLANPTQVYDILTDPQYFTPYENRYAILVKEALEARDGNSINLFEVAKSGHTSPYGQFEIDELDQIIAEEFGGQLTGNLINSVQLFAGHHSRFDDPTSPYYVESDPTYWAYMAEINALGQEVVADVMLHILNTGQRFYARKHSDTFKARALANEFPGVYGY